jgi:hypothetical protein
MKANNSAKRLPHTLRLKKETLAILSTIDLAFVAAHPTPHRAARWPPHAARGQADADHEREPRGPRWRAALPARRSRRVEVT